MLRPYQRPFAGDSLSAIIQIRFTLSIRIYLSVCVDCASSVYRMVDEMRNLKHGLMMALSIMILLLAACNGDESEPLPTSANPETLGAERAANNTATAIMRMTLDSPTPTPTATRTPSMTLTLTPTFTPGRTSTPFPSATFTPSDSPTPSFTPRPTNISTPTPITPTATFTPSITPTRVTNPDAVVGANGTPLLTDASSDAIAVTELPAGTTLDVEQKSVDENWLRVSLSGGRGNGWVKTADVIVFIALADVPIFGVNPDTTDTPGGVVVFNPAPDIGTPQAVTAQTAGDGVNFRDYNYAACGDTYWTGDELTFSMEAVAYEGRYPRFGQEPVRVYVHGLRDLDEATVSAWELAIVQTFAELSQVLRLERVYTDDLNFFQPSVPLETILADRRVDMVWHIMSAENFAAQSICSSPNGCSRYAFNGAVRGGALNFGSAVYVPVDVENKKTALTHQAVHALGLWVHSAASTDLISATNSRADRLSPRDIRTLRCLYNAPPYGDAVIKGQ